MSGTGLVGRAAELTAIAGAVDAVAGGGRRVVVLRGEAGIGKTRLLGELRRRAGTARFLVLEGRSTELEREVPLAPVLELLAPHVGDLEGSVAELIGGPPPASPAERWRLHRALRQLLEGLGARRPLALVLDDLHWSDPATLELVEHLLRRPPERPHLIALGMRPGAAADRLPGAVTGPSLVTLDLAPLDAAAADALLGDVRDPGERARMVRESGGNPLLLEELARSGPGAALPGGVVEAVGAEVRGLAAPARALLGGAAIAGDPFDLDLAGAVAGLSGPDLLAALDAALASGLVAPAGGPRRFAFRHPVVRTAVYEGMPAGRRLAGHAAAARALADAGAPPVSRATHLAFAAEPGDREAASVLREAAAIARPQAPATAAGWLAAARRADPGTGAARRVELAEALAQAGRPGEVLAVVDEGGDSGADEGARLAVAGAGAERLLGRHDAARRRLERALADGPDAEIRARLLCELALSALERGDPADMAARAEQARESGPVDPTVRSATAALLGFARLYSGRHDEARHEIEASLAELGRASESDLMGAGDLLTAVPWSVLAVERFEDALSSGRRVAEAARRRGDATAAAGPEAAAVQALALLGRVREAAEAADQAEQGARLTGSAQAVQWTLWMRAWALLERGDLDAALASAKESVALTEGLDESVLSMIARAVLGAVLVARGEHRPGRELIARYDADPGWICRWTPWLVEADLELGDLAAAGDHAARAAALAPTLGLAGARAASGRAGARVALARGDAGEAVRLARSAAADADAVGATLDAARALILAGRALGPGDRDAAVAALEDARARAAACGADRVGDEAVRELRRLGRRVGRGGARAAGGDGLAALTGREREIAELVAAGLTNRQIGARIHLSEKTVETHLSRVFAKLGVRGRAAVAARIAGGT